MKSCGSHIMTAIEKNFGLFETTISIFKKRLRQSLRYALKGYR